MGYLHAPAPHEDYPLIVSVTPESLVPLSEQLERAGIVLMVHEEKLKSTLVREEPYSIRVNASKNRGVRPSDVTFENRERGLTLAEGIALVTQYPEVIAEHSIDLVASSYGAECTPTIYAWNGRIMLSAICSDVSDAMCGAPVTIDP